MSTELHVRRPAGPRVAGDGRGKVRRTTARPADDALQNAVLTSVRLAGITTDDRGLIQVFNAGAERMLGYTAADVANQVTVADLSSPQELIARAGALSVELGTAIGPGIDAMVARAARGREDTYDWTFLRKDGSRVPAAVSVSALRNAQHAIVGYALIATDRLDCQRLEQELQEKNAALERANLTKSGFLSSMSHELRSPLNAILGFAQLLDVDAATPPPHKIKIAQILHAGWHLLELINGILDLAQIEAGRLSLSMENVALAEIMEECQAVAEPQRQARGIVMTVPARDASCVVRADRTRLKQVLNTLVANALKSTPHGGTVAVECASGAPDRLRISVRDIGPGLPPEKLSELFQSFPRFGQPESMEEAGGIALVLCRRLVELMGGVIGAESTVGVGSLFWFELAATDSPAAGQPRPEPVAAAHVLAGAGKRVRTVLYVEDNPANLTMVEQLLGRHSDIRLMSARNGQLGIQIAREAQPDVILMDINLPGLSGVDAMQILREDPVTSHIPIVALSANAMPRDIRKGLAAGFFRYLTKPLKVDAFMDTLKTALAFAEHETRTSP